MAKFTLDNIRKAAQAKYGSTEITLDDEFVVELQNPLRLPKSKRAELAGLQARLDAGDLDQEDVLATTVHLVAKSEAAATRLLDEVGDDLTVLVEIFKEYSEGTQAGEASASEN